MPWQRVGKVRIGGLWRLDTPHVGMRSAAWDGFVPWHGKIGRIDDPRAKQSSEPCLSS